MVVVKKVDVDAQVVTVLSDGVLEQVSFDKFLTIPQVSDVVAIQQSLDGESKYVILDSSDVVKSNEKSTKSKMVAGILGIFLGYLGIHNFYLGYTSKGVLQLLGMTVGWITFGLIPFIVWIWAFIESIMILVSSPGSKWHKDANGLELLD